MYGEWKGHKSAAETPVDNLHIGTRKKHPDREYEANFSYGTSEKQETKKKPGEIWGFGAILLITARKNW